jgi:hypothetical protein
MKYQFKTKKVNYDYGDDDDDDDDDNDNDERLCIAAMFYTWVGCQSDSGHLD